MADTATDTSGKNSGPKFPDVVVDMDSFMADGNAFALMGVVTRALKRAGHGDQVDAFREEAMSGDYDHLLVTCMRWVAID